MEDLSTEYPRSTSAYSFDQAMVAMKWLAGFHAAFWGLDIPELATTVEAPLKVENPDETKGVWRQGGYWYLDTRREELESMVDSQEYEWLSPAVAETVQDLLRREDVPGRTLIHGDMKAANIVFSETWKECAMYDFQYVGKGLGVQDIVKLLGTSVGRQIMRDDGLVERLLTGYHEELARRLEAMGKDLGGYTREVMEKQLEVAMVDWYRFQAGWGFWGNGWVSEKKVRATVARLEKQGDWNF